MKSLRITLLSLVLLIAGSNSFAGSAQQDYKELVDAITLGASLSRADITCDEFITNMKEFSKASRYFLSFGVEAGEADARDAKAELNAFITIDIEKVFTDLGESMQPNLLKCESRLQELAPLFGE